MKTKIILLISALITLSSLAQNGINYKAVIKDGSGNLVSNQNVTVQLAILEGVGMTNVYTESHNSMTDSNGLIIVNLGEGTPLSGSFNTVAWPGDEHHLNVQVDIGAGLVDFGTTQFMAVPYALNAANVSGLEAIDEGNGIGWRLMGRDPGDHEPIGSNAVDFGWSFNAGQNGASGQSAFAVGAETLASGSYSTALGFNSTASGNYSTAIGAGKAEADYSFGGGFFSFAFGDYSTAIGKNVLARSYAETVFGTWSEDYTPQANGTTQWNALDRIFTVGNGFDSTTPSNALTILKNGTITAPSFDLTEIIDNKALVTKEYVDVNASSGLEALTEGFNPGWRLIGRDPLNHGPVGDSAIDLSASDLPSETNGATGAVSFATGFRTSASAIASTAMGSGSLASGSNSMAMGSNSIASGITSTAMGSNTSASGDFSTAMGSNSSAAGNFSVAMGNDSEASGSDSSAFGSSTIASGSNSTAMGGGTNAIGSATTAMGSLTSAIGNFSTSMGFATSANAYNSTAIGRYNVGNGTGGSWISTDPLFEIGNGSTSVNTSNALTVLKNGNTGVNTATPSSLLEVAHLNILPVPSNFKNAFSVNNIGAGHSWQMYTVSDGYLALYKDGDYRGVFNGVTGAYGNVSDVRLKSDIQDLNSGVLDKVMDLRPVSYKMKNQKNEERHIGLIAQDVQSLFSEVINTATDSNKTLTINYSELVPVLIKSIQEQQTTIDQLKARIELLENN